MSKTFDACVQIAKLVKEMQSVMSSPATGKTKYELVLSLSKEIDAIRSVNHFPDLEWSTCDGSYEDDARVVLRAYEEMAEDLKLALGKIDPSEEVVG